MDHVLTEKARARAAVRIGLASPETILAWSTGEVVSGETLNYRTGRPVAGGLFCERIFGPERDHECACGKCRGIKFTGKRCERCGVLVGPSRARRQRMGHIELAAPVVHLWFFKLRPSALAHLIGVPTAALERIVYLQDYLVVDHGTTTLRKGQVLTEDKLRAARERFGEGFEALTGAEAIERLLRDFDAAALAQTLRQRLAALVQSARPSAERQAKLVRRLKVVEALARGGNQPDWMVLRRIPVIPPDLRPIIRLESGNYASSDLNDLYRRILQRNARLKKLLDDQAPEIILRNERRLLQQAVDSLFDNTRSTRPVIGAGNRPLRSLGDLLKGKEGRFRQNLLGKRVDFSARSVIVVGPELKLHQCGLPKAIALELFSPHILGRLLKTGAAATIRRALRMLQERDPAVWDALAEVMRGHPVLLNRAPTLHRMGIQAFEPVLVEGSALRLHPLVCKAFNADFDGDQMAVHLPLSTQAQAEAWERLAPARNVLSPANGQPVITPSKDMVLGCYHLTTPADDREGNAFHGPDEVRRTFDAGKVAIHDRVRLRLPAGRAVFTEDGGPQGPMLRTTVGRVLFDEVVPAGLPFYDLPMTARNLSRVIADCRARLGEQATITLLERVKEIGFREATRSGLSFSADDLRSPTGKARILAETERAAQKVRDRYLAGDVTDGERREKVVGLWLRAAKTIREDLIAELAADRREGRANPVYVMLTSGARGSAEQLGQLAGMRGLMTRPTGEVLETPIRSSFREGLSVLEYFSSTHGARKGLVDTALKTSESGYLTRKLVDAAQGVIVTMDDCGTPRGVRKSTAGEGALVGRVSCATIAHPVTDAEIVAAGEMIGADQAKVLAGLKLDAVEVRSPLTCEALRGVCRLCYGMDRSTGRLVELGTAVGVIAAQSIGEPATQLILRTFQTGGTASAPDITAGLPRVVALFEAHKPARPAVLAAIDGVVRLGGPKELHRARRVIFVRPADDRGRPVGKETAHPVPKGLEVRVATGDRVRAGQALTDGTPSPHDLLRTAGLEAVRTYLLDEIQGAYRLQGVEVDDKHVEVILARMLGSVKVRDGGDTDLLPGTVVERSALRAANARLGAGTAVARSAGRAKPAQGRPATGVSVLLGVSRAALQADGFLSAASFQETTRVLAEAALAGKVDELAGLKENVLLGRLVPTGTGFRLASAPGQDAPAQGQ
jgi:DNA-directed RNA polymerase subunit beta'